MLLLLLLFLVLSLFCSLCFCFMAKLLCVCIYRFCVKYFNSFRAQVIPTMVVVDGYSVGLFFVCLANGKYRIHKQFVWVHTPQNMCDVLVECKICAASANAQENNNKIEHSSLGSFAIFTAHPALPTAVDRAPGQIEKRLKNRGRRKNNQCWAYFKRSGAKASLCAKYPIYVLMATIEMIIAYR